MARAALAALLSLVLVAVVSGHGGGLHEWTFLPTPSEGKEFIRHAVASCSSFAPVPSTVMLGALPVFPAVNSSISVTGTVTIFTYLDGNCTDRATTAPDVNLQVTLNGQPYANRQINGYGFTGNCSAPGDLYRNNVTRGDDRFNLVYWYKENSMTDENGTTWGAAPNVFVLREPSAPNALRSIVLYPSPADSAPVCCNLVYNEPAPADFLTQGSFCRVPAPPPPSPPSPHSPPPKSSHNPPPRRRPPPRRMHNRRLF